MINPVSSKPKELRTNNRLCWLSGFEVGQWTDDWVFLDERYRGLQVSRSGELCVMQVKRWRMGLTKVIGFHSRMNFAKPC